MIIINSEKRIYISLIKYPYLFMKIKYHSLWGTYYQIIDIKEIKSRAVWSSTILRVFDSKWIMELTDFEKARVDIYRKYFLTAKINMLIVLRPNTRKKEK